MLGYQPTPSSTSRSSTKNWTSGQIMANCVQTGRVVTLVRVSARPNRPPSSTSRRLKIRVWRQTHLPDVPTQVHPTLLHFWVPRPAAVLQSRVEAAAATATLAESIVCYENAAGGIHCESDERSHQSNVDSAQTTPTLCPFT